MKATYARRRIRRSAGWEAATFKKENQQEQTFFGDAVHDSFFKPAVAVPQAGIQRKCAECEKEEKVQRAPEKKEEEKLQRMPEKKEEEKVQRMAGPKEEEKVQRAPEKKEEEKLQRIPEKKEEEKVQRMIGIKDEMKVQRAPEKKEEKKVQRLSEKKEEEKLQKKEANPSHGATAIGSYVGSLSGKGQPLPAQANAFFSSKMGYDFSHVKTHHDKEAADSAKAVNAKAYTIGNNVVFNEGQYDTQSSEGKKLMAHELTHVVQQGSASKIKADKNTVTRKAAGPQPGTGASNLIQRAGDPTKIPGGLSCPTSLGVGSPGDADLLFANDTTTITGSHTLSLIGFAIAWMLRGGNNNVLIHGFASTDGTDERNWALSCNRAEAVRNELIRLGIPPVRIRVLAHGKTTDFGAAQAPNRRATVSMTGRSFFPLVMGTLTPQDNFAGRSATRFGVGEVIDLDFLSLPFRPAADFGGLEWVRVSGGGSLVTAPGTGTGTYTAPGVAATVQLELRVATGLLAGRVLASRSIDVVEPDGLRQVIVPGTSPNFGGWGAAPLGAGDWGVGFQANEFIAPRNVSFRGVEFQEGAVPAVATGFLASFNGTPHGANSHGLGLAGNAVTGTPLGTAGPDGVWMRGLTPHNFLGIQFCGAGTFLWAIPMLYRVTGGAFTPFAGAFTSNQIFISGLGCQVTVLKSGAGPVCRNLNGTSC